jgi:hypothetical protein
LSDALEKLKGNAKRCKWKTFRSALKSVWRENKIEALQRRLGEFREELIIRILMSFR